MLCKGILKACSYDFSGTYTFKKKVFNQVRMNIIKQSNTCLLFSRISVIFRVRSAKAVKITDMDLIKRTGVIVAIFVLFLLIRTLVSPPQVIIGKLTTKYLKKASI